MAGIFGDQIGDGAIPEGKLGPDTQNKLNAGLQMATGFYDGDGTDDRVISTGLTTINDLRFVVKEDRGGGTFASYTVFKTDGMAGKECFLASTGSTGIRLTEVAFVGGNFTVDSGNMNSTGGLTWRYFWTAFGT